MRCILILKIMFQFLPVPSSSVSIYFSSFNTIICKEEVLPKRTALQTQLAISADLVQQTFTGGFVKYQLVRSWR